MMEANPLTSWLATLPITSFQVVLLSIVLLLALFIEFRATFQRRADGNAKNLPEAPSPLCLPIIGHIYKLAAYPENPWEGFNAIRRQFGDVVRLKLGNYQTIMVSSVEAIREVLLIKGEVFGDRPHFHRHALIFGSNRQNALALCDWTESHKARRSIAHAAVIPRFGSNCFRRLSTCIQGGVDRLLEHFDGETKDGSIRLKKQRINMLCVEIFIEFLLEKRVDITDQEVKDVAQGYDFIFYDINQMYLCDFIPAFSVFSKRYLNFVEKNADNLRNFIENNVIPRLEYLIEQRKETSQKKSESLKRNESMSKLEANEEEDMSYEDRFVDQILLNKQYNSNARFLDFVLNHYLDNPQDMTWEECLYEIGDLVGGNSAVSNLLTRVLGWLALSQDVQESIYQEAISVVKDNELKTGKARITLEDRLHMPLMSSAIMETLRLASSPIVPHLARKDTSIQGYFVPKNTMVLFNIYHMNLSPDHWKEPRRFNPSRFVSDYGNIIKPEYFFPFSHGRRSCLGYKMVNTIIFATVANIVLNYKIEAGDEANRKLMETWLEPKGTIALPFNEDECFHLNLAARK